MPFQNATDGFLGGVTIDTLAATGSTQANCTSLVSKGITTVTAADAAKGILLPRTDTNNSIGTSVLIVNTAAAVLKVYPFYDTVGARASGGTIDGAAVNVAKSQIASSSLIYTCTAPNTWKSAQLS